VQGSGGVQRVFLFVAVAGLAPWLTITSYDVANYALGAEQILSGQSVYGPRVPSLATDQLVPSYPYLPSFAILLALGTARFFLLFELGAVPEVVFEVVARQVANAPGYLALVGVPALAYCVLTSTQRSDVGGGEEASDWLLCGVLVVALAPPLWFQVLGSGSDTFVALLALLGVFAVMKGYWTTAGLLVGTATFKYLSTHARFCVSGGHGESPRRA